jgi:hypothetical protein
MLAAFSFQSYVDQTHIHPASSFSKITAQGASQFSLDSSHSSPGKYPANDDPANCPICQQFLLYGHFVTSTTFVVFLLAVVGSASEPQFFTVSKFDSVSHNWRGRAPPRI